MTNDLPVIKFSHPYYKLVPFNLSEPFTLLEIFVVKSFHDLSNSFLIYDTSHSEGRYELSFGQLIVLILAQGYKIMTTIRPFTKPKFDYYNSLLGKQVMCKVVRGRARV